MESQEQENVDVGRIPGVGEVIHDRYRLDSVVATGGMGVIMRAKQLAMDRDVAIKLLHPHMASDPDTVARFEREVHLAKHLSHPHTIQLFDFGKTDTGSLYIVMEYLEGRDLKEILNSNGPLPLGRAVEIGLQTLDGLAEAHGHDVIHRDLKPSNIFIQEDRRGGDFVKILDFGIAKSLEGGGGTALTATGQVCGTPQYMAPEAVLRRSTGKAGDVYAMGLIMMEMLIGRRVFDAESMPQTIMLQMNEPVPIPERVGETDFKEVVEKATAKHPDDRYQDADEFFEALDAVANSLPDDLTLEPYEIPTVSAPDSSDMLDQLPREVDSNDIELLDRRPHDDSGDILPDADIGTPDGSRPGMEPTDPQELAPEPIDSSTPPPQPEEEAADSDKLKVDDTVITPAPAEAEPETEGEPTIQTTERPDFEAPPELENTVEFPDDLDETVPERPAPETEGFTDTESDEFTENDAFGTETLADRIVLYVKDFDIQKLDVDPSDPRVVGGAFFGILLMGSLIFMMLPDGSESGGRAADTDKDGRSSSRASAVREKNKDEEPTKEEEADEKGVAAEKDEEDEAETDGETAAGTASSGDEQEEAPDEENNAEAADSSDDEEESRQASNDSDPEEQKPTKVTVRINTYPTHAALYRDGDRLGLTPHKFELEEDADPIDFRLIRKGYYPKNIEVDVSEETDYRVALRRRRQKQAQNDNDDKRTGAGSTSTGGSGRSSEKSSAEKKKQTDDKIENILDEHSLD